MNNDKQKYQTLLGELDHMIASKGKGYKMAAEMNHEFWENLGIHHKRLTEQMGKFERTQDEKQLQQEFETADSVYEATRNYIAKYK